MKEKDTSEIIGQMLNEKYLVLEELGHGSFAEVFRGIHKELDRPVAIKVLTEQWVPNQAIMNRFEWEARALAQLSHPNIVNLLDYGVFASRPYLVMELIPGKTLAQLLDDGSLSAEQAFVISEQILIAIQFAHEKGIAHRDLKPENIVLQSLLHTDSHVKILDFGFAKFMLPDKGKDNGPHTAPGIAFGTPAYIAPEQLAGAPADYRVDFYATGIMLYQMLAGRRPFEGNSVELMKAKIDMSPPRLQDFCKGYIVTEELEDFLKKCLKRDPKKRFQSAGEMLTALKALPRPLVGSKVSSGQGQATFGGRKKSRWFRGVAAMSLLIGAGLLMSSVFMDKSDTLPETNASMSHGGQGNVFTGKNELSDATGISSVMNPFGEEEKLPSLLSDVHKAIALKQKVTEEKIKKLRLYAKLYDSDPRADLLLGHVYHSLHWYADCLKRYEKAHRTDSSSRGDPRLLSNLLSMAKRPNVGVRASEFIKRIYGKEALWAVERARHDKNLTADEAARLARLRKQLQNLR